MVFATRMDCPGRTIENAKIEYAWVRPNEGIGNPHASVDEEL